MKTQAPIMEIQNSLKSGAFSLSEYAASRVADAQKDDCNSIISCDAAQVQQQVDLIEKNLSTGKDLPLYGAVLGAKDNIDTLCYRTTGGTASLANHQPKNNAPVIERLIKAGAVIAAKTNMHELAFGITSNNGHTGAVKNPHDSTRIAGGSSGGSAASVASGIFHAAIGTDTGGSCRIPSALCGIYGFRPSMGRYPQQGMIPLSSTRDTAGPLAKNLEDIILLDAVMTHSQPRNLSAASLKGKKFAMPTQMFEIADDTKPAINDGLDKLRQAGAELIEIDYEAIIAMTNEISFTIVLYETNKLMAEYTKAAGIALQDLIAQVKSPDVQGVLQAATGQPVPEDAYQAAINTSLPKLRQAYADIFKNGVTGIVQPTTPLAATKIGEDETVSFKNEALPTFMTYIRNCDPISNIGAPGLTIPVGSTADNLPVGLEMQAPINADEDLFTWALALQ